MHLSVALLTVVAGMIGPQKQPGKLVIQPIAPAKDIRRYEKPKPSLPSHCIPPSDGRRPESSGHQTPAGSDA